MGREATCRVRREGRSEERKTLLETDELILRGEPRIVIPRCDITSATAAEGILRIVWSGGAVELELGKDAERWAKDITNPKTRLEKLGVKAGQRVLLTGVTDGALRGELDAAGATVVARGRDLDVVFLQVDAPAGLARLEKAAALIAPTGAVWVLSPRGVPGLKDTDVMAAGKATGLVDVKVVRFSETHSANKLVVPRTRR